MNFVDIVKVIIILMIYVVLAVQAYSDYKSMQLYTMLTYAAVIFGCVLFFISVDIATGSREVVSSLLYFFAGVIFILIQYAMGAFAFGDAKLLIVLLQLVTISETGIDIFIRFLFTELAAVVIFIIYTSIAKIIKKEKGRKNYPYAPAIFAAALTIFI